MTKEIKMNLRRIYNIIFSIMIVIAGICLIAGCLSIYLSGDQPFSRESVAATFSGIAFPIYLCLAMTIISFVLEVIAPSNKEKAPVFKPYVAILERLHSNRDLRQCDEAIRNEICALQKNRKLHVIIRTVVLSISSIVFLVYALNGSNYHQSEINNSMINAMMVLTPCLLISFAYALFVSVHNEKSVEKEIELIKQLPVAQNADISEDIQETDSEKKQNISRSVIVTVAIVFIVYGLISGGTVDVLAKAINICTECIGLG